MFKIGDKVRVTRGLEAIEYYASPELRAGSTGTVVREAYTDGDERVGVDMDSSFGQSGIVDHWNYPSEYLELVEEGAV